MSRIAGVGALYPGLEAAEGSMGWARVGWIVLVSSGIGCGPAPSSPDAGASGDAGAAWRWERHVLTNEFVGEGVAAFDVDLDGALDVVCPPYWWAGPSFVERHEIAAPPAVPLDPRADYGANYGVFPQDVDGDGCTDVVLAPRESAEEMYWYESPRGADGGCGDPGTHWARHMIISEEQASGTASPILVPLIAGREPVLVMADASRHSSTLGWWAPGDDPTQPWQIHPISASGFAGATWHGIGAGDVDGDGDADVLHALAWFEQTPPPSAGGDPGWIEHPFPAEVRARDPWVTCSRMWAHHVDGDDDADVLCARPHDYGLYWWEQTEDTFVAHAIDDRSLSQMHSLRLADLDGDGEPELVTGKRWYAHLDPGDPGQHDPAVLAAWSIHRDPGGLRFERHEIDSDSGAGAQLDVADLDGDGRADVVTANKKGVFYFLRR